MKCISRPHALRLQSSFLPLGGIIIILFGVGGVRTVFLGGEVDVDELVSGRVLIIVPHTRLPR